MEKLRHILHTCEILPTAMRWGEENKLNVRLIDDSQREVREIVKQSA